MKKPFWWQVAGFALSIRGFPAGLPEELVANPEEYEVLLEDDKWHRLDIQDFTHKTAEEWKEITGFSHVHPTMFVYMEGVGIRVVHRQHVSAFRRWNENVEPEYAQIEEVLLKALDKDDGG